MGTRVKALVLPIFRRHWLWNAWGDQAAQSAGQKVVRHWRDGSTLEERFSILGDQISGKIAHRLVAEWNKLESAKEGSLRNRMYRLAQAVLAREDPQESFLKAVPTDNGELQIIYPSIVSERLVRRRLRVLMHQGRRRHRVRLMLWSLLFLPQIPLMVTPLPNITVYYTVYRIWSHASALQGSRTLDKCFAALDTQQLATLRDDLLRLQASTGIVYPPDSWPARLIKKESRYLDIFNSLRRLQQQRRLEAQLQRQQSAVPTAAALLDPHALPSSQMHPPPVAASAPKYNHGDKGEHHGSDSSQEETAHVCTSSTGLHLIFSKSSELCDLVRPIDRERTPLGDEAALAIGKYFKAPHLLENVARARRRAIGSMFPAHSHEW